MADDYRNTVTGSGILGSVSTAGSASGSIEIAGDRDVFATILIASLTYTFEQTGDDGSLMDSHLWLLSGSGSLISDNNDYGTLDSRIVYTAQSTDTYFLQAAGHDTRIGTYEVYVSEGVGSAGDDAIEGTSVADAINGGGGNDTIVGGAGNDSLQGGEGTNVVHGGVGDDFLDMRNGSDTLFGEDGNDQLSGLNPESTLIGGTGNDHYYLANSGDAELYRYSDCRIGSRRDRFGGNARVRRNLLHPARGG